MDPLGCAHFVQTQCQRPAMHTYDQGRAGKDCEGHSTGFPQCDMLACKMGQQPQAKQNQQLNLYKFLSVLQWSWANIACTTTVWFS